jgi:SAM-dependent MidA family methyltransferase
LGGVRGVIFSNELLDAQPTHRFAWDRAQSVWFEWRVGLSNDGFQWVRSDNLEVEFLEALGERVPSKILQVLPDHYVVELSPAAEQWWRAAAGALQRGWLLTFDYGFDDDTALMPERTGGTLRGYRLHQAVSDVLANPGTQDVTVHVHFGRIRRAGEWVGLETEFCGEQGRFLTQCAADLLGSNEVARHFDAARLRQFKTLIHPDHFGRSFRVLLQSRL